MNPFSAIYRQPLNGPIASVNRQTRELFIDPEKFDNLKTDEHREYVILHEKGHIILNTADEYAANRYALENFIHLSTISNDELKKKLTVLSDISKIDTTSFNGEISNFDISAISGLTQGMGDIFQTLPALGVGRVARETEANNANKNLLLLEQQKSATIVNTILITGILIIVGIALFFTFKK